MQRPSYITVKGIKPHRGVKVTIAEFRRMWTDPKLTIDDIARTLNISETAVRYRAFHRGMPDRRPVYWAGLCGFDSDFARYYVARVTSESLAAHYGRTVSAVEKHARKIGVKRSRRVSRWDPGITLDDYHALRLRDRMAVSARDEQAALLLSEMVDNPQQAMRRAA